MFHRTQVKHVPMTKPVAGKTTRTSMIGLGLSVFAQVVQTVKNLPPMQETWALSLGWEDPWRRKWQPTPEFLPGEFHGQRSLVSYSPQGRRVGPN